MEHLITVVIILLIALPCYLGLRRIARIVAGKTKGCGCSTNSSSCTCSENTARAPQAASQRAHSSAAAALEGAKDQHCQCGSECQCKQQLSCEQAKQGAQERAHKNEAQSDHISF